MLRCHVMQMKVPLSLKVRPLGSADALLSQPAHRSHTATGQCWAARGQHPRQCTINLKTAAAAPPASVLAQPCANSAALLVAKIEQMQGQAFDADSVLQNSDVQQRVNAAAAVAANVPLNAVLYHNLEPVDEPQVPVESARLVAKQLHPAWVAKRHMKPALQDLWTMQEQHAAVLTTDVAQHHVRLSRKHVADVLLQLT